ncbi:MAG: hypothetical protein AMJ46_05440 [Latescibacteria bacterium DG_63]|nr:MAG: hypothetical protein AMJ46_05440 [Latescibacteria bacterium DG_63]
MSLTTPYAAHGGRTKNQQKQALSQLSQRVTVIRAKFLLTEEVVLIPAMCSRHGLCQRVAHSERSSLPYRTGFKTLAWRVTNDG